MLLNSKISPYAELETLVEDDNLLSAQSAVAAAVVASGHWHQGYGGDERLTNELAIHALKDVLSEGPETTVVLSPVLKADLRRTFSEFGPENVFRISIENLAYCVALNDEKNLTEVACAVLNRPRNQDLIDRLCKIGVQVILVGDIDPKSILMLEEKEKPVDFAFGISAPSNDLLGEI